MTKILKSDQPETKLETQVAQVIKKKLTPDQVSEIIWLAQHHVAIVKIAAYYEVSSSTVKYHLDNAPHRIIPASIPSLLLYKELIETMQKQQELPSEQEHLEVIQLKADSISNHISSITRNISEIFSA